MCTTRELERSFAWAESRSVFESNFEAQILWPGKTRKRVEIVPTFPRLRKRSVPAVRIDLCPPVIPRFLVIFHWFSDCAQKPRQWGLFWDGHNRNYRSAPESRGFEARFAPKISVGRFRGQHVPMAQSCSDAMIRHNHCDIDDGILNGEWARKAKAKAPDGVRIVSIPSDKIIDLDMRLEASC